MSRDLSRDEVLKGLACIGRHPLYLRHAYLECNVSELGVTDISTIAKYPHLMYVNCSKNKLRSLKPLADVPTLVQLNASDNELVECLDFAPPRCSFDNAWATGHNAVGSMLTLADLSNNKIASMKSLDEHPFLECLLLNNNFIPSIFGLENLQFLQVLDLSYNKLESISGLDGLRIQELILRGNSIKTLNGLDNLPCLITLDVAFNNVSDMSGLAQCDQLNYLDISNNCVTNIRQLDYLSPLQWMRRLILVNNECCNLKLYRSRVIFRLPQIVQLDSTNVSAEDKIAAMNLYGDVGGDKEMRRMVFAKYFGDEPFIDFSEHLSDGEDN
jgi:hypothetical protein